MEPLPLVGKTEIAMRAGVLQGVVYDWRNRYPDFPAPVAELRMGWVWWWPEVEKWLKNTGRRTDANWTLEQVNKHSRHKQAPYSRRRPQGEASA